MSFSFDEILFIRKKSMLKKREIIYMFFLNEKKFLNLFFNY